MTFDYINFERNIMGGNIKRLIFEGVVISGYSLDGVLLNLMIGMDIEILEESLIEPRGIVFNVV